MNLKDIYCGLEIGMRPIPRITLLIYFHYFFNFLNIFPLKVTEIPLLSGINQLILLSGNSIINHIKVLVREYQ